MNITTHTALAGLLGFVLSSGALYAHAGPDGQDSPGGRGPGRPPRELLDKYDLDQDGVLSPEEHAAIRRDIEDGKLHLLLPSPREAGSG